MKSRGFGKWINGCFASRGGGGWFGFEEVVSALVARTGINRPCYWYKVH